MSWLFIALISHALFAIVFALDKVLVSRYLSPARYVEAVGMFGALSLILIPFVDFEIPTFSTIVLALISGITLITGLYCYFRALEHEETSWVAPLLFGVVLPVASLGINYHALDERFEGYQLFSFALLILGGLILSYHGKFSRRALGFLVAAGIFLAIDSTVLKLIFETTNFASGYITSRLAASLVVLFAVWYLRGGSRSTEQIHWRGGMLFGAKQILSFGANLLLLYAIFLASPTLVNASNGFRYIFLFPLLLVFARIWPHVLEERITAKLIIKKCIALLCITAGLIGISVIPFRGEAKVWGITYSSIYASQFGFDSREAFTRIVEDLGVRDVRLVAYWPLIEPQEGVYDFSELDFELETLERYGGKAIIAMGVRLPRWPECHIPEWARGLNFLVFQNNVHEYIESVVLRYRGNPVVEAWQVENEPFLFGFGECPDPDIDFLDREIAQVKRLDARPVIVTDSGELGRWHRAYQRGDVFGTTMYRTVWNEYIPGGYFMYPLPPGFFTFKAGLMEALFGKKEIMGIELQAEPWTHKRPWDTPLDEQRNVFSLEDFKDNITYAKNVGFTKNYLWGAEWWLWMKDTQNHPEYWEYAKTLFSP